MRRWGQLRKRINNNSMDCPPTLQKTHSLLTYPNGVGTALNKKLYR